MTKIVFSLRRDLSHCMTPITSKYLLSFLALSSTYTTVLKSHICIYVDHEILHTHYQDCKLRRTILLTISFVGNTYVFQCFMYVEMQIPYYNPLAQKSLEKKIILLI